MSGGVACKCCGGRTVVFGTHDAARSCQDRRGGRVFPVSADKITYRRCAACDLVFTTDLDTWTDAEMAARIYNDDYILADPDFATDRPAYLADMLAPLLEPFRASLSILDYGGGQGRLAELMRARGFGCESHDPFFGAQRLDQAAHDLVTAFEVFEHSRTPIDTFGAAASALRPGGSLLFSTLVRPRGAGIGWWYIGPRNGHVTMHSTLSLRAAARALGMAFVPLDDGLHLFHPATGSALADHLLAQFAHSAAYAASLRGASDWLHTTRALLAGPVAARRAALDPRHPLRVLRAELGLIRKRG